MNMAMGPCLAWPRSRSDGMSGCPFSKAAPLPSLENPLLFFIPQQWAIRFAQLASLAPQPPRSRQCRTGGRSLGARAAENRTEKKKIRRLIHVWDNLV